MFKVALCENKNQVITFLNNMEFIGYNVKDSIISFTQDRGNFTIFYKYDKNLGTPSMYEF